MNVLAIYRDGRHKEFRPTYIPLEGDGFRAQLEEDELITKYIKTHGIYYRRAYWSTDSNDERLLNDGKIKPIIKLEEYPDIYQIQVNGMVVFEGNDSGGLDLAFG